MKTLAAAIFFGCLFLGLGYSVGNFLHDGYANAIGISWQREQMNIMRSEAQTTLHKLFRESSGV